MCAIESTPAGMKGEPNAPVSIVKARTSPASFARCIGERRFPTDRELRDGLVPLDAEGKVIHSERHDLCPSWQKDKREDLSRAVGTGRESRRGAPLPMLEAPHGR